MKQWFVVVAVVLSWTKAGFALPTPPEELAQPQPEWSEIVLRVDVRNLTGPEGVGTVTDQVMLDRVADASRMWSQCAIRFEARSQANVSAVKLNIPYEPKSVNDLSTIDGALYPSGTGNNGAIPLTIAGPWRFVDTGSGLMLFGLGWSFSKDSRPTSIGAMIGANRLNEPWVAELVGHEIGHALSLSHSPESDNLMAGGKRLKPDQCKQARGYAQTVLAEFISDSVRTPVLTMKETETSPKL